MYELTTERQFYQAEQTDYVQVVKETTESIVAQTVGRIIVGAQGTHTTRDGFIGCVKVSIGFTFSIFCTILLLLFFCYYCCDLQFLFN